MKQYQIKNSIGSGNFSTVWKVEHPETKKIYALKIMKTHSKIAYRQAQILKGMDHPNVIKLYDFQQNQDESRLLLEYVGINTLQLYESHAFGLREQQVKCILFQASLGLAHVHSFGIINRDVKPENLLIDKKNALVKIIDFGLAISENSVSTDYIATRWYRAPQNLLSTKEYMCAVDVFSLACVIVELYLGSPLFPGTNNVDQISKIFNILGCPTQQTWPHGFKKMVQLGIKINQSTNRMNLKTILSKCDPLLVDILQKMLELNPRKRIKCSEIVKHPYFHNVKMIVPPFVYNRFQEDFGKPRHQQNNYKHQRTQKSEKSDKSYKNKYGKVAFRGMHQLKHPKPFIKQTIDVNNLKKRTLSKHPSSLKSLQHQNRSKQNSSVHSESSGSHSIGTKNRPSLGYFPSNLIRTRNRTDHGAQKTSYCHEHPQTPLNNSLASSINQGRSIIRNNFVIPNKNLARTNQDPQNSSSKRSTGDSVKKMTVDRVEQQYQISGNEKSRINSQNSPFHAPSQFVPPMSQANRHIRIHGVPDNPMRNYNGSPNFNHVIQRNINQFPNSPHHPNSPQHRLANNEPVNKNSNHSNSFQRNSSRETNLRLLHSPQKIQSPTMKTSPSLAMLNLAQSPQGRHLLGRIIQSPDQHVPNSPIYSPQHRNFININSNQRNNPSQNLQRNNFKQFMSPEQRQYHLPEIKNPNQFFGHQNSHFRQGNPHSLHFEKQKQGNVYHF